MSRSAAPLETFGDYPPVLYRAFNKREHAEAFVQHGKIRLGLLNHYCEIEDAQRSDTSEGTGSITAPGIVTQVAMTRTGTITRQWEEPGPVHHSVVFTNAVYILSLSYPTDENCAILRNKFGVHVVRINAPRQLGQDITDALHSGPDDTAGVVECVRVIYNKGATVDAPLDRDTRLRLAYGQKPPEFEPEHEYRLVLISQRVATGAAPFLHVNVGRPLLYAEIVA